MYLILFDGDYLSNLRIEDVYFSRLTCFSVFRLEHAASVLINSMLLTQLRASITSIHYYFEIVQVPRTSCRANARSHLIVIDCTE